MPNAVKRVYAEASDPVHPSSGLRGRQFACTGYSQIANQCRTARVLSVGFRISDRSLNRAGDYGVREDT